MLRILEETGMPDELRHTVQRSNRFFNIGVFLHNPFAPWRRGRLVLVGACALRSKGSKLSAAGLEGKNALARPTTAAVHGSGIYVIMYAHVY